MRIVDDECCLCNSFGTIYAKTISYANKNVIGVDRYCERHRHKMSSYNDVEITEDEYLLILAMEAL